MSLLWALWEKELAAEAFTQGKTQEICSLGSWDPGFWGKSLSPGVFRYQRGGCAGASLVHEPFMDQSGLGRNTAADAPCALSGFTIKDIFF